jgi:hypothetical protein
MAGDSLIAADTIYPEVPLLHVSAEYLLWWTRGSNFPPLVTTDSPAAPEDARGALPPTGTGVVIYGGQQDDRLQSGARFNATYWLGCPRCWGLDAGFFFLGERSERFFASSDQFPVLARPFNNVFTGPDRQLVSTPGTQPGDFFQLRGSISVDAPSKLWGWDVAMRRCLFHEECWNLYLLAGYRYLDLEEGLDILEDITSLRAVPGTTLLDPGNRILVFDSFNTDNQFHGGQIGLHGEVRRGNFVFEGKAKVSIGCTRQEVVIAGGQRITRLDGTSQSFNGGLLALPSNIGEVSQTRFAVVPEVGVKVGYQVTENLRAFVGYDFLYWSSVLRPGDQIDTRLNPLLIPNFIIPPQPFQGPLVPAVPFRTTHYWAHGLSFGVELRF